MWGDQLFYLLSIRSCEYVQVKVPVGKHCGFVQFVRKADAERAIEKMQGFPIGGSRIRLSWGRSQCMRPFLHVIVVTNYLLR